MMSDTLTFEEISVFLNESYPNSRFTANELKQVSSETVILIYSQLLNEIGYPEDCYFQPGNLEARNCLAGSEIELYDGFLPNVHFCLTLMNICNVLGYDISLELDDITHPKPRATRSRLSYLIQFVRFFRNEKEQFEDLIADQASFMEIVEKFQLSNCELQSQINNQHFEAETIKANINLLATSQIFNHQVDLKEKKKKDTAELKLEVATLEEQKNTLLHNIAIENEKIEKLHKVIVLDPKKEKELDDQIHLEKKELKEAILSLEDNFQKLNTKRKTGFRFPQKEKALEKLEDNLKTIPKAEEKKTDMKTTNVEIQSMEIEIRDQQCRHQLIKEDLLSLGAQHTKNKNFYDKMIEEQEEKNRELLDQLSARKVTRADAEQIQNQHGANKGKELVQCFKSKQEKYRKMWTEYTDSIDKLITKGNYIREREEKRQKAITDAVQLIYKKFHLED